MNYKKLFPFVLILLVISIYAIEHPSPVVDNTNLAPAIHESEHLVGYWQLNETTGTTAYDSSVYGNDGTWKGNGSINYTTGVYSTAFDFDGVNDNVTVPDSNSLDASGELTISAWVRLKAYPTDAVGEILSKWEDDLTHNERSYLLDVRKSDSKYRFFISEDGTTATGVVSNNIATLNNWTHVVGTKNSTTLVIYLNGTYDNHATGAYGNIYNSIAELTIGSLHPNGSVPGHLNASIDDVLLFNRTLTSEEILALYNSRQIPDNDNAGTGERVAGNTYWANDTAIQIFLFGHANMPGQVNELHLLINNQKVQDISLRPIGQAEQTNTSISAIIPKGANYSVEVNNNHHYEWYEYPFR